MRTRAMYSPEVREFLSERKLLPPPPEKPAGPKPLHPSRHYRACKDEQFPGSWRVEPVSYTGVGIVYLFHGETAEADAIACANSKNAIAAAWKKKRG